MYSDCLVRSGIFQVYFDFFKVINVMSISPVQVTLKGSPRGLFFLRKKFLC